MGTTYPTFWSIWFNVLLKKSSLPPVMIGIKSSYRLPTSCWETYIYGQKYRIKRWTFLLRGLWYVGTWSYVFDHDLLRWWPVMRNYLVFKYIHDEKRTFQTVKIYRSTTSSPELTKGIVPVPLTEKSHRKTNIEWIMTTEIWRDKMLTFIPSHCPDTHSQSRTRGVSFLL